MRIAVLSLGLTGCVIGTWRMHPGADMARLEDVCDTRVVCIAGGARELGGTGATISMALGLGLAP